MTKRTAVAVGISSLLTFDTACGQSSAMDGGKIAISPASIRAEPVLPLLKSLGTSQKQLDFVRSSISSNPSTLLSATISLPAAAPSLPGGEFGHGYISASRALLPNDCVKVARIDTVTGPAQHGTVSQGSFAEISQYDNFRSATGTSLSASVMYDGFSLGGGTSNAASKAFDSFSRFIVAYRQVVLNEFVGVGTAANGVFELTDEAKKLKDPVLFKQKCGDYFLSGYKTGGKLSILATVSVNTDASFTQNRSDVNVGFADIFGASFGQSSNYSKVKSASSFNIDDYSEGVPAAVTVTMDTLQSAYVNYQNAVLADQKVSGQKLLSFVFTPYSSVIGISGKPDVSVLTDEMLNELQYKRDSANVIDNNLRKAEAATNQGYAIFKVDISLADARTEINAFKQSVAAAIDTCRVAIDAKTCQDAIAAVKPVPPNHVTVGP